MERDYASIERDIENARNQLAGTLDELALRADPKRIVEQGKLSALGVLSKPAVQAALAGVGILIVALVVRKARR